MTDKKELHPTPLSSVSFSDSPRTMTLHFVGARPFDDISPDEIADIWPQLQAAQTMLDAYFDATKIL